MESMPEGRCGGAAPHGVEAARPVYGNAFRRVCQRQSDGSMAVAFR